MQRFATFPVEHWSDKVMSVLREQQLEACQERLSRCPQKGLFDDITDLELREIFAGSYLAWEMRTDSPDLGDVRKTVLDAAAEEACFLSEREDNLVKRMIIGEGSVYLDDWEDISAAESLVKRMWCTIHIDFEKDMAVLRMQQKVMDEVMRGMSEAHYPRIRQAVFRFEATLNALLYLSGFLHATVPARHFMEQLHREKLPADKHLIGRYLKSAFDYWHHEHEEMLLVHPGLYDPGNLIERLKGLGVPEMQLTHAMMLGGMNGMLPEERASSESLRFALHGAVRPELDEEDVLDDLRMMAKQGASLEEMREVLENCLCVMPTPAMLSALYQVHMQTVRWLGMPPAVVN